MAMTLHNDDDQKWKNLHSTLWDSLRRGDDIPINELPQEICTHLASHGAAQPVYDDVIHVRAEDVLAALSHFED
jgi:hypothetical protein